MKYGYARVSTPDQDLSLQIDALHKYGVDCIWEEKVSGKNNNKPVLDKLLSKLQSGDQLIVWKLDRLGRRTSKLMELKDDLEKRNISLISLTEQLDTSTPVGKFAFHILCCVAEMERNIISERTKAGLASARNKGRIGGRPLGLTKENEKKAQLAVIEYLKYLGYERDTIEEAYKAVGIARSTFYKYLKLKGVKLQKRRLPRFYK